jgi:hypothetical protein
MGQPHRMGDNRLQPPSEVCPECGSVDTLVMTMKSPDAVSCRCTVCAHVWRGGTSDSLTKTAMFPDQPGVFARRPAAATRMSQMRVAQYRTGHCNLVLRLLPLPPLRRDLGLPRSSPRPANIG